MPVQEDKAPGGETAAALARRAELCQSRRHLNYAEGYRRLHPEVETDVLPLGGGAAVYLAPGSPLNHARGLGMDGEVTGHDLDALEDFFARRGQPTRMHVCPLAHPSLHEQVRARGYRLLAFFSVLVKRIPPDFQPGQLPAGLRLTQAGPAEADLWLGTSARGFGEDGGDDALAEILGPNFYAPQSAALLAWIDNQPAGSGGAYFAPEVAALELGGASTLPRFRRRGVQTALVAARLALGLRQGCDLAVVMTEPGTDSQRNLQRAGFSLAYTKIVMESAPPPAA